MTNVASAAYTLPDNTHASEANVGQCTWYVYGRIQETGLITAQQLLNLNLFQGDADSWSADARRANFTVDNQSQPGAIAYWDYTDASGNKFKHVAFVENSSGQFSQSNMMPGTASNPTYPYEVVIDGYWVSPTGIPYYPYVNLRQLPDPTSALVWKIPQFTVMKVMGVSKTTPDGYQWFPMESKDRKYAGYAALLDANSGKAALPSNLGWNFTCIQSSPGGYWLRQPPDGYIHLPSEATLAAGPVTNPANGHQY
jgi:surface antigen